VLGAGFALVAAGRLLGIQELYVLGTTAVVLVVLAFVQVRASTPALTATRQLSPSKVHAGTDSRVELAVRNESARRTPVLSVRDPFDRGRRQARFLLAPLRPGEVARAAYRLPTQRRGVYTLGPLEVSRADSFGLASLSAVAAPATELTVFPAVDEIVALPHTIGHDPYAGADHPNTLGQMGEDFYALRPYEVGDDLRRVHWPATARLDELMIRQDELPWQGRATVLLDVRRRAHSAESFELAVSAAASIVSASWRRRALVRLVTTEGLDTGFAAGAAHAEALMEHLAVIRPGRLDRLPAVLASLRRGGSGGALAAVTGVAPADDLDALLRLRARFGAVTVVVFDPSAWDPGAARRSPTVGGGSEDLAAGIVRVTADRPFAAAWNQVMSGAGRRVGV
jgi:uncharacterized protein (DUF58 family)